MNITINDTLYTVEKTETHNRLSHYNEQHKTWVHLHFPLSLDNLDNQKIAKTFTDTLSSLYIEKLLSRGDAHVR